MNGFPVQVKSVTVSQAVNLLFSILYDASQRVVEFAHCRCGAYWEFQNHQNPTKIGLMIRLLNTPLSP